MTKAAKPASAKTPPKPRFDKSAFYRLCRMLHAYISAFAFLTLIFFSITGVMLNHPAWFESFNAKETTAETTISAGEIAKAKASADPGRALGTAVAAHTPLKGAFSSGDVMDGQALLRFDGPKGTTDVDLDLTTGKAQVKTATAPAMVMIQDLHRGKNSGAAWRWVIDLSAYLILALSLIGYVLFFSLRFRLKNSLILTGVSLAIMIGIVMVFVA